MKLGVPKIFKKFTLNFKYNDVKDLEDIIKKNKNNISCLIMEASNITHPKILGEIKKLKNIISYNSTKKLYKKKSFFEICRKNMQKK